MLVCVFHGLNNFKILAVCKWNGIYTSALIGHIQKLHLLGDWQISIDSISGFGLTKIHRRFFNFEIFCVVKA